MGWCHHEKEPECKCQCRTRKVRAHRRIVRPEARVYHQNIWPSRTVGPKSQSSGATLRRSKNPLWLKLARNYSLTTKTFEEQGMGNQESVLIFPKWNSRYALSGRTTGRRQHRLAAWSGRVTVSPVLPSWPCSARSCNRLASTA